MLTTYIYIIHNNNWFILFSPSQTIPKYEYKYEVHDPKTGDIKEQKEERYGDKVKGEYSLKEPDGTVRVVKYEADKENGFNAKVERQGHALHPYYYKKD